jgi:hypothetical protein
MARISSVTTPQPKSAAPPTVGRVVPAQNRDAVTSPIHNPKDPAIAKLFDCHAGERGSVFQHLPTYQAPILPTEPPEGYIDLHLVPASVAGARNTRALRYYNAIRKAETTQAYVMVCTGSRDVNNVRKALRKYADKDNCYLKMSHNADYTRLYAWLSTRRPNDVEKD